MSLTIPQNFDVNHNPSEEVIYYGTSSMMSKRCLGPSTGLPTWKNYGHPLHQRGGFAQEVKTLSGEKPFATSMSGNGPNPTGELFQLLKLGDIASDVLNILITGVYNNAASFNFVIGESTPPEGRGNIVINNTNITVTQDDGTVASAAHGGSWVADERFAIGLNITNVAPLINRFLNTGDSISSAFVGVGIANAGLTIVDEITIGNVGAPVHISGFLIARSTQGVILDPTKLMSKWRMGDFVLTEELSS